MFLGANPNAACQSVALVTGIVSGISKEGSDSGIPIKREIWKFDFIWVELEFDYKQEFSRSKETSVKSLWVKK